MGILDDLLATVDSELLDVQVRDLRVGLYWTAVLSRHLGLAATPTDTACCWADDIEDTGKLHLQTVGELLPLLRSSHPLEVSIGMAALNSALEFPEEAAHEIHGRDLLMERGRGKTVVTVGHFPFTDMLRTVARQLWVLELTPYDGDVSSDRAAELIPQADVIGLTASTLLNNTFDELAKLFPPNALVVMLGPSTPLHPVLFDYGVDILGGSRASDPETVFRFVTQGSALHKVPVLRRITLAKEAFHIHGSKTTAAA